MSYQIGKMGTFKNKEPADSHPEEGTLYLSSTGQSFKQPKIDADLINQYRENSYVSSGLDKVQRILFQDDIAVSVIDKDSGETDEKLSSIVTDMAVSVDFDFILQQLWRDSAEWGPGICNPVYEYAGPEYRLTNLRRLDPLGFSSSGSFGANVVKNRILPGILFNPETKVIEFWNKSGYGAPTKIENVVLFTDPLKTEVGGTPFIIPILPFVKMASFAWTAQMQKVNQHGSGGIWFLKVTNPRGDDKAYAQKILRNAGKNTAFQLRENMEVISLGVGQNGSALETITEIGMIIRQFFSPAGLVSKEGSLIAGSNDAEYKLYLSYIKGQHRWIERRAAKIFEPWLRVNGYADRYRLIVDIPEPTVDRSEFTLKLLDSAQANNRILPSEARKAYTDLGLPLPELTPEQQAELDGQQSQDQMLQKAKLVVDAIASNDMDPEHLISEDDAKAVINKALRL